MKVATYNVYTGRGRPPARGAAIRTIDGRPAIVTGYFATGRGTGVIAYTADGFTRLTVCAVRTARGHRLRDSLFCRARIDGERALRLALRLRARH